MIKFREQENVIIMKRRHHLILVKNLLGVSLVFVTTIISMAVVFFGSFSFPESLAEVFPFLLEYKARIFILYFLSLLLLVLWQIVFVILTNYYLDCWVVTNERTIHTELKALFSRVLSSVPHNRIQDITVSVQGILPTIFHYGDLQIQTAGKFQEFLFKQIPKPYETKEIIFKAQKEYFNEMKKRGISPEKIMQEEGDSIPV